MAKVKKYKLNDHEKEIIKCFRQRTEHNASKLIDVNVLEFIEENRDGIYRLTAMVKFSSFVMRVYYYPSAFLESDYIDFSLKFPVSEYKFSIYDIFNYFDINDFELYYYGGCDVKSSVETAVDNIFSVCQKYFSDIDYIAKRKDAVAELEKQCDSDDYIKDNDFDDYKADNEDMLDDFEFINILRPIHYGNNAQKVIKKLRKQEKKDLNSLYEKRLLKYLEAGNSISVSSEKNSSKANKKYLKAEIIADVIVAGISFSFTFAAAVIIQKTVFSGAYVPVADSAILSFLGLSYSQLLSIGASGLFLTVAFRSLLGGKIISRFAPEGDKKSFYLKFISEETGVKSEKKAKVLSIIFAVGFTAAAVFMMMLSILDIGFYDDYVKFFSDSNSSLCEVSYDNLEIYRVKYYYDDNEELVENENAYAVADKQHTVYFDIGEVVELGETEKRLMDISTEYGIEIRQIDTLRQLSELCGEIE